MHFIRFPVFDDNEIPSVDEFDSNLDLEKTVSAARKVFSDLSFLNLNFLRLQRYVVLQTLRPKILVFSQRKDKSR